MKTSQKGLMILAAISLAGVAWGCADVLAAIRDQNRRGGSCTQTAQAALKACRLSADEDYWIATGNCENVSGATAKTACERDASAARREIRSECETHFDARKEICRALGEDPYDPIINPENYVTTVTNPFFPLTPGTTFVYQSEEEEITIVVTHETKEILGVTCIVVRDTVRLRESGELVEDTDDWYAQDKDGNVWYMGELSQSFEDGELVSLEGSWKAGVENAKPGIIMLAAPQVGKVYRQEFFLGDAEDMGEVLSITESATVPAASCDGTCLVTKDFLPLDPGHVENKHYAPGVGLILEVNPDTEERVELVSVTNGSGAIPLKEAKLNIEHNATDLDTGFQGGIDGEGWERLDITGPDGTVLTFEGKGELRALGLTELFFETVEPENADVSLDVLLMSLPEGEYKIEGPTADGGWTSGIALLTHDIPAGAVLLSPAAGATVPPNNLVVSWSPVTQTITGESVNIIRYQLIIEKDEPVHPHAIGKRGLSIFVPSSVTSVTVPNEFLEPGTHYLWEVLAIEVSGNQTLASSEFTTQ
jgi:hypothetical protein